MLKMLLISVPFLFAIGSLLHFAYSWSKENKIIGLLAPVNESIFEHSKLLLVPLTLFWTVSYFFVNNININSYFLAMLVSIVISIAFMISFYYTYKGIIGNLYLAVDVFDLFLSLLIGQIVANHVYIYSNGIPFILSITSIVIIFVVYVYLTFKPFKIPFFLDKKSNTYGINKDV